jgi:hypothetical protein
MKNIVVPALIAFLAAPLGNEAHAFSYSVSSTQPAGFHLYDLTPYIGQENFTVPGLGEFVGQGFVYAAGDNTQAPPFPREGSNHNPFIAAEPGTGQTLLFSETRSQFVAELYSPDSYNFLASGSMVVSNFPSGGPLWVTFNGALDEATMTALGSPATEFAPGYISTGATPEASTWMMVAIGFAGLGYAARKKSVLARSVCA